MGLSFHDKQSTTVAIESLCFAVNNSNSIPETGDDDIGVRRSDDIQMISRWSNSSKCIIHEYDKVWQRLPFRDNVHYIANIAAQSTSIAEISGADTKDALIQTFIRGRLNLSNEDTKFSEQSWQRQTLHQIPQVCIACTFWIWCTMYWLPQQMGSQARIPKSRFSLFMDSYGLQSATDPVWECQTI